MARHSTDVEAHRGGLKMEETHSHFLKPSHLIDFHHQSIQKISSELRLKTNDERSLVKACFQWVRDHIQHSLDFERTEVTSRASDVLKLKTGYCCAKSHLLAALLRANEIPAGFCYQRLTVNDDQSSFCLHGLNAVFLNDHGWYRVDARGNKTGVNAQFSPPTEQLAFSTNVIGECDFPHVWPEPLSPVVCSLQTAESVQALAKCLPDILPDEMTRIIDLAPIKPIVLT